MIFPTVQETRTEADFLAHIQQTVENDPQGQWIFIADQLNYLKLPNTIEVLKKAEQKITQKDFVR